jgi:hypothetical protein
MAATDNGAYCDSCALEVIDFTKKSSEEIKLILKSQVNQRVCGQIKDEQLEELNYEFLQWKNNQQSFQRTWVLSLVVVFGLSLFSCQEEQEQEAIVSVQQVGWKVNEHVESISKMLNYAVKDDVEPLKTDIVPVLTEDISDVFVLGEIDFIADDIPVEKEVMLPEIKLERMDSVHRGMMLGGMRLSAEYNEYLHEQVSAEPISLEAIAFPNPAIERTTARITFPEDADASIQLYSISGEFIRNLADKRFEKGVNDIPVNLLNLPKGTYLITINSKEYKKSIQIIKS